MSERVIKQFGLIGYPLANTFSVDYFSRRFRVPGLRDYSYTNFPLRDIGELPQLIGSTPLLQGLNVTMPHKVSVMPFMYKLDRDAARAGAVNCIRLLHEGQVLLGFNTDVYGFRTSLEQFIEADKRVGMKALVLGSGGAAKAVKAALDDLLIPAVFVTRNAGADALRYEDINAGILLTHKLIVNCTPAGMFPATDTMPPFPVQLLDASHFVHDLIYLPDQTRLLNASAQQGAHVKNGLVMLNLQAERSFGIFTADESEFAV
jgi:shikimate dehydrogenase